MPESIKDRLKAVFSDVFDTSPDLISDDCSINNMPSWDSMQSIVLATSIESEFAIEFTDDELVSLDSFGKILGKLEAR